MFAKKTGNICTASFRNAQELNFGFHGKQMPVYFCKPHLKIFVPEMSEAFLW